MITLWELFNAALLPMKDIKTGEKIDSKVVLKNPDARVKNISCDERFNLLVEYEKEPEDEE